MTDKVTPIPKRASRKLERNTPPGALGPEPIMLPTSKPSFEEHIRQLVHAELADLLKEHDTALAGAFYRLVMNWPVAEIMVMGEAEFMARFRSIVEDHSA